METLFEYLLKASAGIILFYLVYRLLLMKETFYEANWWFLVMALLFSVSLPLFPVYYPIVVQAHAGTGIFEGLGRTFTDAQPVQATADQSGISRLHIIFLIYGAGGLILLLRLVIQTVLAP